MNYQSEMEKIIESLDHRPTLLLHSCCGPCSTKVLETLYPYFDITVLYYNPNIEPREEYEKRKSEQIRFIKEFDKGIKFLDVDWDNGAFETAIKGLESEPEGGCRCSVCFHLRMKYTARKAQELGFEYFATTLTVSPYKDSKRINHIGSLLEQEFGIKYLYSDFKKKEGYKRSIELSKEYNLYRQHYCGCTYGRKNE